MTIWGDDYMAADVDCGGYDDDGGDDSDDAAAWG